MEHKTQTLLIDTAVITFLVLFPHFVPLPFYSYTIICFLLIWLRMRKKGWTLRDIGLSKKAFTLRAVLLGVAFALVWVGFMQLIYIPLIKNMFVVPNYTEYNFIQGQLSKLIMIIVAAWVVGGFYEELVFRGFIQSVLKRSFLKTTKIPWSVVVTAVLFGLYHWQQDIFGMVAATLGGLYWGMIYRYSNNLWTTIISHAIFDTLTLVLIYTGVFGNLW